MDRKVAYVGAPLDKEPEGVVQIPVLRIVYRDLSDIKSVDGPIVFTSKRGITSLKMSNVSIKSSRIYCIGRQTSDYLEKLYSKDCEVPEIQDSSGLADLLVGSEGSVNIIGSDQVSKKLLVKLQESGVRVKQTIAYRIEENESVNYGPLRDVKEILVGSSRSFEILIKNAESLINSKELYAIGKPTEETMKRMGYIPTETFEIPDIKDILSKLATKR